MMTPQHQQIIDLVTNEVLKLVPHQVKNNDLGKKTLIIGSCRLLPEAIALKHQLCDIEDIIHIDEIEEIYITELNTTVLAQVALAAVSDQSAKMILDALLLGKKVSLFEKGISHRQHKKTSSATLYQLLEGYVHRLFEFGVVIVSSTQSPVPENTKVNEIIEEKIITEAIAKEFVKTSKQTLLFHKGSIITPSAKDVFREASVLYQFTERKQP